MTSGAISRSWAGLTAFTVPWVPTGMKAGVRTLPRTVAKRPARAGRALAGDSRVNSNREFDDEGMTKLRAPGAKVTTI